MSHGYAYWRVQRLIDDITALIEQARNAVSHNRPDDERPKRKRPAPNLLQP